jgi:hypothetical protein
MTTAVELFIEQLEAQGESWENVSIGRIQISIKVEDYLKLIEQAKEMELQQQGKFTIDFINWLHLNEYKYNPKAKLYQKQFINETLFFSIDELFITFKSK